jgi:hypothetical protein
MVAPSLIFMSLLSDLDAGARTSSKNGSFAPPALAERSHGGLVAAYPWFAARSR